MTWAVVAWRGALWCTRDLRYGWVVVMDMRSGWAVCRECSSLVALSSPWYVLRPASGSTIPHLIVVVVVV